MLKCVKYFLSQQYRDEATLFVIFIVKFEERPSVLSAFLLLEKNGLLKTWSDRAAMLAVIYLFLQTCIILESHKHILYLE